MSISLSLWEVSEYLTLQRMSFLITALSFVFSPDLYFKNVPIIQRHDSDAKVNGMTCVNGMACMSSKRFWGWKPAVESWFGDKLPSGWKNGCLSKYFCLKACSCGGKMLMYLLRNVNLKKNTIGWLDAGSSLARCGIFCLNQFAAPIHWWQKCLYAT